MYEFDYEWTFRGELVAGTLEEATTTSTTGRITANVQATRYLVIPPGLLTAGAVYTFILSAAFDSVGLDGCANGDDDGVRQACARGHFPRSWARALFRPLSFKGRKGQSLAVRTMNNVR